MVRPKERRSRHPHRFPRLSLTRLAAAGVFLASSTGAALAADDLQSLSQDDRQWVMAEKNYAATRR